MPSLYSVYEDVIRIINKMNLDVNCWCIYVVSAETVNTFKNRLDKFWSDHEVLYDYKTDLHGIGNRSIV